MQYYTFDLWTWWRILRSVCNYHIFWQIQIQMLTHGPKMYTWFGTTNHGTSSKLTWQSLYLPWWHWYLLRNLGRTPFHSQKSLVLPWSKKRHHNYQVCMGYQRSRLAWILVNTNWTQAMEEMHFCNPWTRTTSKPQGNAWFPWCCQYFLAHVV